MDGARVWGTVLVGLVLAGVRLVGAEGAMEVFVSLPPQACFVERVGGTRVDVQVLVQSGQDPHTFEPSPRQMMALGRAALYFTVGVPFEDRLVAKIRGTHRDLRVVDTDEGIEKRVMDAHHEGEQEHDDEHGEERDPHIWLSPPLIRIQARAVARALEEADPAYAEEYGRNLEGFLRDLDDVHKRIGRLLAPYKGEAFYVFHPAFGYFGDAYGLRQEAVEMEGKSPTPRQLVGLIERARTHGARIIFVQPQFARKSADAVATAIGGAVVAMDPMARDVLGNLEEMAGKIVECGMRNAECGMSEADSGR